MMNALFPTHQRESREGGREGGRGFSVQSRHVICSSLEMGISKKGPAPDPRLAGDVVEEGLRGAGRGGWGEGGMGGREGEEGSTLTAIMSFDVGLLASP